MTVGFSKISSFMKICLSYSQIFGQKASIEEIKHDLRCINIDDALSILAQFTVGLSTQNQTTFLRAFLL